MELVPNDVVKTFGVLPVKIEANLLTVAMTNPFSSDFFDFFQSDQPDVILKVCLVNDVDFKKLNTKLVRSSAGLEGNVIPKLDLSTPTVMNLSEEERFSSVHKSKYFSTLNPQLLKQVMPYFKFSTLQSGDSFVESDELGDSIITVVEGELEILRPLKHGGYSSVGTIKAGETYGVVSLITESKNSLLVHVKSSTKIFHLRKQVFKALVEKQASFSMSICKNLSGELQELNRQTGIKYFSQDFDVDYELCLKHLELNVIQENKVLPIHEVRKELTVGFVESHQERAFQIINRYMSGYHVNLVLLRDDVFEDAMQSLRNKKTTIDNDKMRKQKPTFERARIRDKSEAPQFVEEVIVRAYELRASDIHFEPSEDSLSIRFRVDGELRDSGDNVDMDFGAQVINSLKILSDLDISEQRLPQDGQLVLNKNGLDYQARTSTVPTKHGEKVVLRLVNKLSSLIPLNALVPDKGVIKFLRDVTRMKQGLFLITGPTGSGKTTTLYSSNERAC